MRSLPHALHATPSSDEAWDHVPNDHFHGILLVHSRLAIIHTDHNAAAWEELITRQEETEAPHKISRISRKISTLGGGIWATPNSITADRQHWFTGKTVEERQVGQHQLIIHIPDHLHTSAEELGPKIERLTQQHDTEATFENNDPNTATPETHQIHATKDVQGQWSGSFRYLAPSKEAVDSIQKELDHSGHLQRDRI